MKIQHRILVRAENSFLIIFLFFMMSLYSCSSSFGQELNADYLGNRMTNAGKNISLNLNLNDYLKAEPLGSLINSPYAELKPVLVPNGNRLYFSRSYHPDNTGGENDSEDIWFTQLNKTKTTWSAPIRMSGIINNAGPNFIQSVSATGDTIILGNQYLKRGKMRNGVSYSVNVNGTWSKPRAIVIENDYNTSDHENHFVNLKNGIIISSVQRTGSVGERDLYVSFWNGEYASEPINLGNVINSNLEESSPFLASDNKTLYFASKGHNGFGGYDIFMSERQDDSWVNWSVPVNLGPSVNGALDEEFFTITNCGKFGIFSKQINIHNSDLFRISLEAIPSIPALTSNLYLKSRALTLIDL
jgi:OmpA-OmpF porin, OOP family